MLCVWDGLLVGWVKQADAAEEPGAFDSGERTRWPEPQLIDAFDEAVRQAKGQGSELRVDPSDANSP